MKIYKIANANVLLQALDKIIDWSSQSPDEPAWPNAPITRKQYVQGFVRKSGSYVPEITDLESFRTFLSRLTDVKQVDSSTMPQGSAKPGNTYWEASVPQGYSAFENIAMLSDLKDDELSQVTISKGGHGIEFNLPSKARKTNSIKIITSPTEGLVTWYPGRFTPYFSNPELDEAVKNGLDLSKCKIARKGNGFVIIGESVNIPVQDATVKFK